MLQLTKESLKEFTKKLNNPKYMPTVKGKKFPYTKKGKKAAMMKKKEMKMKRKMI